VSLSSDIDGTLLIEEIPPIAIEKVEKYHLARKN
jgi:hypothetical protein